MICAFPSRFKNYTADTPLVRLFDAALAGQLLPSDDSRGYCVDAGACICLPSASLTIAHRGQHPSIDGFSYAEIADISSEDVLVIDLDDVGDRVECELHLFAPSWTHSFSVPRLALWVSPHELTALVPIEPRNAIDLLPPSFALTDSGIRFLADPFLDAEEWRDGINRAVDAVYRPPAAQPVKSTPKLRLVR